MRRTATNNHPTRALLVLLAAAVAAAGLLALVGAKPAWAASRSLAPAKPYTVGDGPSSVTSAHFNDDGKADLAVANAASNNVSVLLGSDNGTFQEAQNLSAGDGPNSVI